MAKNLLFSLIFYTLPFVCLSASAANEAVSSENIILKADECNAPTPDSFRITSVGGSFISLAWKPAWVGATHVLTVSEKNPSGGWTTQYVLPNVPDSAHTVDNLEGGKEYRFRIATKCPSGDPSELTAFVDGIALIVDLTLLGRNPKNPSVIDCQGIMYQSHEWVGFRVSGEGESNLFEVKINEDSDSPIGFINRVANNNPIVAVTENNNFPNNNIPVYHEVPVPFKIRHIKPDGPVNIGYVDLVVYLTNPPTIDLCDVLNSLSKPWNNGYIFTALTAKETIITSPGGGPVQGFGKVPTSTSFEVQNPFKDMIRVFVPQHYKERGKAIIRLLNSNGQMMLMQKFDYLNAEVSIPVESFPSGVYILQIETNDETQTLKIVKSE